MGQHTHHYLHINCLSTCFVTFLQSLYDICIFCNKDKHCSKESNDLVIVNTVQDPLYPSILFSHQQCTLPFPLLSPTVEYHLLAVYGTGYTTIISATCVQSDLICSSRSSDSRLLRQTEGDQPQHLCTYHIKCETLTHIQQK